MSLHRKILIITSVEVEKDAVLQGIGNDARFDVIVSGVGQAASAAVTSQVLSKNTYDLVMCIGIAGGFSPIANVGSVSLATDIIAADLGVQTKEGFVPINKLGFGVNSFRIDENLVLQISNALRKSPLTVAVGPIVTVSTATGTKETEIRLSKQHPGVVAEAMEGFGVAMAASIYNVPFVEIRAISNLVGPRDRDSWKIEEALDRIREVSTILKEVL